MAFPALFHTPDEKLMSVQHKHAAEHSSSMQRSNVSAQKLLLCMYSDKTLATLEEFTMMFLGIHNKLYSK